MSIFTLSENDYGTIILAKTKEDFFEKIEKWFFETWSFLMEEDKVAHKKDVKTIDDLKNDYEEFKSNLKEYLQTEYEGYVYNIRICNL